MMGGVLFPRYLTGSCHYVAYAGGFGLDEVSCQKETEEFWQNFVQYHLKTIQIKIIITIK